MTILIKKTSNNFFILIFYLLFFGCTANTNAPSENNPVKSSKKNESVNGSLVYKQHCMECHQENGDGVPDIYPSLNNEDWVGGDNNRLIEIILAGMKDQILVNGATYQDEMPKADYLTNKEIAAVLSYIRSNFNNNYEPVSDLEVARVRIRLKSKK
jgi:mono/diheme cytochrome c family protein